MCGIVAQAQRQRGDPDSSVPPAPPSASQPDVLWRDDNFTIYREKMNPVSSKGHLVVAFNLHVPSIYMLSSSDLPLLSFIRDIAIRLLSSPLKPGTPLSTPTSPTPLTSALEPPCAHTQIPVTDHLHAHAFIAPADQLGWFRGIAYSALAWYDIDDLIAEIRESVSNNRVKSGYGNRQDAPINLVPDAGARAGTANGRETTELSLASDIEEGRPHSGGPPIPSVTLSPPSHGT
ncbi:hypothetical protein BGW80DRAFT_1453511 [Lactifluus volemus]|nr:hypothetical protein BGW80DRAFT_1453511 [Lactifluus volemus]